MNSIQASIITIGDELLIGQTIDTNSAWIAQELNKQGIEVLRRVAVGDTNNAIRSALDEELSKADIVLITGGLGPTADDITKPLLREYFGGNMVIDQKTSEHIQEIFRVRKRPFLDVNLKQAEVPDTCTVLFNKLGTAPGMWFEKGGKIIVAMPGVPFEMMGLMENEVLPRLEKLFFTDFIVHRSIITAGEGESFIAEKIKDIEGSLPADIKLAYLPQVGMVKLRLTGRTKNEAELIPRIEDFQSQIAERLEDIVVATEDIPLEEVVAKTLLGTGQTIGLAESCTGGYVSHKLTQIPGASKYFLGAVVCYDYEVKTEVLDVPENTLLTHGAVSEETVIEMAQNARKLLKTDYALSISGILGPDGGTPDKPVGTVWMAVANSERTYTKKFRFFYDRIRNKEMATNMALLMMWRFIKGKI